MKYRLLGKSGLRVSELCLGTMTFGEDWGSGANQEVSKQMFDLFLREGGNFLDTANMYTGGTSENFLGELIQSERDNLVIATKYSLSMDKSKANLSGNHRKNLVQSVEKSLKRLKTPYLDLLWVHAWDFTTSPETCMRALDDLVRQGKVLHVGISDAPAWIVARANTTAELRGWSPFIGIQVEYSLIERTVERELIPMAAELGLAVLAWSPLGAGTLTGKYLSKNDDGRFRDETRTDYFASKARSDRSLTIARVVVDIAEEIGVTPSQVALAWLRQHSKNVIPIIGARKVEQLQDNLACLNLQLNESYLAKLNQVSAIELGFPYQFLEQEPIQQNVYGNYLDRLEGFKPYRLE